MTENEISSNAKSLPSFHVDESAGKAYQMVAQSVAIAIQDATDNLRNINAIYNTAVGVALAEMLANPDNAGAYNTVVEKINQLSAIAVNNFKAMGECAADVLKAFPSGS